MHALICFQPIRMLKSHVLWLVLTCLVENECSGQFLLVLVPTWGKIWTLYILRRESTISLVLYFRDGLRPAQIFCLFLWKAALMNLSEFLFQLSSPPLVIWYSSVLPSFTLLQLIWNYFLDLVSLIPGIYANSPCIISILLWDLEWTDYPWVGVISKWVFKTGCFTIKSMG